MPKLKLLGTLAFHWRATTDYAIYTQPANPVAGTVERGTRWTGAYAQLLRSTAT
jgi:hypothetical protein